MRRAGRGEDSLALIGVGVGEAAAGVGQADVAFLQHGEAQQVQRFAQRQQLVGLVLQRAASAGRSARPL
jgi:hypothetical protein